MLIRMKYKYYHGYSKAKVVLSEDPVLDGCENHPQRQALKGQLINGRISQSTYDNLRSGLLKKGRGGEASPCIKLELNHGDLVVMHGENLQRYYEVRPPNSDSQNLLSDPHFSLAFSHPRKKTAICLDRSSYKV